MGESKGSQGAALEESRFGAHHSNPGAEPAQPALFCACTVPERLENSAPKMLYSNITMEDAMHTTNLRKVGGSIMLAVPPALLELLRLRPGAKVGIEVRSGRLVVEPQPRPRYTLDELLAQCDPKAPRSKRPRSKRKEERDWLDSKPVGGEII